MSIVPRAGAFPVSDAEGIMKNMDLTVTVSSKDQAHDDDDYGKSWEAECSPNPGTAFSR